MMNNPMSVMNDASKLSAQQLQQAIQNGTVPAYIGIPLLKEKLDEQKRAQTMAAAQQGPAKPPVAQQIMQGVSGLPSQITEETYAGGGIVAFADGGGTDSPAGRYVRGPLKDALWDKIYTFPQTELLRARLQGKMNPIGSSFTEMSPEKEQLYKEIYPQLGKMNFGELRSLEQGVIPTTAGGKVEGREVPTPQQAQQNAGIQAFAPPPMYESPEDLMLRTGSSAGVRSGVGDLGPVPGVSAGHISAPVMTFDPTSRDAAKYSDAETNAANEMAGVKALYGEDKGREALKAKIAKMQEDAAGEEERAPWAALTKAGLATMAGRSPFALTNLGEGGKEGLEEYTKLKEKAEKSAEKRFELESRLAEAQRAENIAAANTGFQSATTKKAANKTVELQKAVAKEQIDQFNVGNRFTAASENARLAQAASIASANMQMRNRELAAQMEHYRATERKNPQALQAEYINHKQQLDALDAHLGKYGAALEKQNPQEFANLTKQRDSHRYAIDAMDAWFESSKGYGARQETSQYVAKVGMLKELEKQIPNIQDPREKAAAQADRDALYRELMGTEATPVAPNNPTVPYGNGFMYTGQYSKR